MKTFIQANKVLIVIFILSLITVGNAIACYKPQPTVEPSIAIEPTTEISEEPTVAPTIGLEETPTASPEATVAPQGTGQGDGKSDGRSDGLSSCPSCTQAPVIPQGAPATGRS